MVLGVFSFSPALIYEEISFFTTPLLHYNSFFFLLNILSYFSCVDNLNIFIRTMFPVSANLKIFGDYVN